MGMINDHCRRVGAARFEGGGVSMLRTTLLRTAAPMTVFVIILSACTGGATTAPSSPPSNAPAAASASAAASQAAAASLAPCGTVNIAVNPWVGYEADAAVVGY